VKTCYEKSPNPGAGKMMKTVLFENSGKGCDDLKWESEGETKFCSPPDGASTEYSPTGTITHFKGCDTGRGRVAGFKLLEDGVEKTFSCPHGSIVEPTW